MADDGPSRTARRTHVFTESVIREMTRVARQHGAINLAQGFPDFPAPALLKEAACEAVRADINQYAITWGADPLRRALAGKYRRLYGMEVDPEEEVTVTCGATEAMAAAMLALVDPGDEVIVLEPFYENYGPDAVLCGAKPVFVRAELEVIARLCAEHDALAFTDEIYEHILYEGEHVPLATLPGMRERTVTISGFSKTFAVTGWRVGTMVAPRALTAAIRKTHDFLTVGAPAPLQEACAAGLERLGAEYYDELANSYRRRRDVLYDGLIAAGFRCARPAGAYYILADFSGLSDLPDDEFARWLAREVGVAPVPGSSFYAEPGRGRARVRFAFCKTLETLERAAERLAGARG